MNIVEPEIIGTLKVIGELFEWIIPRWIWSSKRSELFTYSRIPDFKFYLTLKEYIDASAKENSLWVQLHRIPVSNCEDASENFNGFTLELRFIYYKAKVPYMINHAINIEDSPVRVDFPHFLSYDSLAIQGKMILKFSTFNPEKYRSQEVSNSFRKTARPEEFHTLAHDMSALLNSGNYSDVALCVEDKTFHVHRCILVTRSKVLAAMFYHDTQEKMENRIVIVDFSSDIIYQVLKYIYTDQIDELTPDQYLLLYRAADKYAITDLRKKCSQKLKKHLPLKYVVDALVTADLHQDKDLFEVALQIFLNNAVSVMNDEKWLPFMRNHIELASEILMHLAKKSSA